MCTVIAQLLILYNSIQTYNIILYIKINTDFSKIFFIIKMKLCIHLNSTLLIENICLINFKTSVCITLIIKYM